MFVFFENEQTENCIKQLSVSYKSSRLLQIFKSSFSI
jgi:hypothetical protein